MVELAVSYKRDIVEKDENESIVEITDSLKNTLFPYLVELELGVAAADYENRKIKI